MKRSSALSEWERSWQKTWSKVGMPGCELPVGGRGGVLTARTLDIFLWRSTLAGH